MCAARYSGNSSPRASSAFRLERSGNSSPRAAAFDPEWHSGNSSPRASAHTVTRPGQKNPNEKIAHSGNSSPSASDVDPPELHRHSGHASAVLGRSMRKMKISSWLTSQGDWFVFISRLLRNSTGDPLSLSGSFELSASPWPREEGYASARKVVNWLKSTSGESAGVDSVRFEAILLLFNKLEGKVVGQKRRAGDLRRDRPDPLMITMN